MRIINCNEFIKRLKLIMDNGGRIGFFIGAGCSISSGIPSASSLTMRWLRQLREVKGETDSDFELWLDSKYPGCKDNPALYYGRAIEELYPSSIERQKEIEKISESIDPGFGYAMLAQLLTHEAYGRQCNMVITTNFDDLIADALYVYTQKKPLVIYHESLAAFFRLSEIRPTIIKIHGDARLFPKNTENETSALDDLFVKVLHSLLREVTLIFIGYGGNDESVRKIMRDLPDSSLPGGIYWVNDCVPNNDFGRFLEDKNALWVKHQDFDELMLRVKVDFSLSLPKKDRFEKLFMTCTDTFTSLDKSIKQKTPSTEKEELQDAVKKTASEFEGPWAVIVKANMDRINADSIYENGLRYFPNDANIIESYAIFLAHNQKEQIKAEAFFKMAIELDPNNVINLINYGIFLSNAKRQPNEARKYFDMASKIDSNNPNLLIGYADLFYNFDRNYKKAGELYESALTLSPNNSSLLANYAGFLYDVRKDYSKAGELYKKALELDHDNEYILNNYANFVYNVYRDYDKAEEFYRKSVELNPNYSIILANYAGFLYDVRKDYSKAEELYKKALALDPNNPDILVGWAGYVARVLNDYDTARDVYERAFQIDPRSANVLGNYAIFLYRFCRNHDKAEMLFKRVLESDRKSPAFLGEYASFLYEVRNNNKTAELYYIQSISAMPSDCNLICNFAGFLLATGKYSQGLKLIQHMHTSCTVTSICELESLFYLYAHHRDEKTRNESLISLKRCLLSHHRSTINFYLNGNVNRAIQDHHPNSDFLSVLAQVITNKCQIEELDRFMMWRNLEV